MTEFELTTEVQKFYTGYLDLDKALKLYELEFGFIPDIEEDEDVKCINHDLSNLPGYEEYMNREHFTYLKKLQESGEVNMFMSRPYVERVFGLGSKESGKIILFYMNNYDAIYFPENLI